MSLPNVNNGNEMALGIWACSNSPGLRTSKTGNCCLSCKKVSIFITSIAIYTNVHATAMAAVVFSKKL